MEHDIAWPEGSGGDTEAGILLAIFRDSSQHVAGGEDCDTVGRSAADPDAERASHRDVPRFGGEGEAMAMVGEWHAPYPAVLGLER